MRGRLLSSLKIKEDKFAELRDAILSKKSVSIKTLQKFAGRTTFFVLLVSAAKLYSNSMFLLFPAKTGQTT